MSAHEFEKSPPPSYSSSNHVFYFHRLTTIRHMHKESNHRTPKAFFLGDFGFQGHYEMGDTKLTLGVYLCEGRDELPRPIRCVVSAIDLTGKGQPDVVLIDDTRSTVAQWAVGAQIKFKRFKEIGHLVDGDVNWDCALFRYDVTWA